MYVMVFLTYFLESCFLCCFSFSFTTHNDFIKVTTCLFCSIDNPVKSTSINTFQRRSLYDRVGVFFNKIIVLVVSVSENLAFYVSISAPSFTYTANI